MHCSKPGESEFEKVQSFTAIRATPRICDNAGYVCIGADFSFLFITFAGVLV